MKESEEVQVAHWLGDHRKEPERSAIRLAAAAWQKTLGRPMTENELVCFESGWDAARIYLGV